MTNATTKDQIIALFQDNLDNEISASDMRVYIEAIFDTKEEIITKINTFDDLLANNTHIYEGSLVVIYSGVDTGLYLSIINQPQAITDFIKI